MVSFSRKRSGTSLTLPPLDHRGYVRPRRGGRVRTVPTSRVSSSKLSRFEPVPGKRSRSASGKAGQGQAIHVQNLAMADDSNQVQGNDWFSRLDASFGGKRSRSASQEPDMALLTNREEAANIKQKTDLEKIGRRRLSKVETVRVLRARSALLLPLPAPPPIPLPTHYQPIVLKSDTNISRTEERKKKRR